MADSRVEQELSKFLLLLQAIDGRDKSSSLLHIESRSLGSHVYTYYLVSC